MSEELKPCPACGSVAILYDTFTEQEHCACGVSGPDYCGSEEEAITAWNALPRRADIERVARERDWLASERAASKSCPTCPAERPHGVNCTTVRPDEKTPCERCWLEAARQATAEC